MLKDYATLVFDCDGVILDSNRVKTEAFREAALPYGPEAADRLVAYHTSHGGISRYVKFRHFLDEIVTDGQEGPDLDGLLAAYGDAVRTGLMQCDVTPGLEALRAALPDQRWLIVSGGDQTELRQVFAARGLDHVFDGGIFGSPDSKDEILAREKENGNIAGKALFLGDSTYDYSAASAAGLDFVFVSGWSEVADWPEFVRDNGLSAVARVEDLIDRPDAGPIRFAPLSNEPPEPMATADPECANLEALLEQDGMGPVLVAYERAATAIYDGGQHGLELQEALAAWHTKMEHLLRICRKHRHNLALVDADTLRAAPQATLERLKAHLPALERLSQLPSVPDHADRDSILTVIAEYAVLQQDNVIALSRELEARALPSSVLDNVSAIVQRAALSYITLDQVRRKPNADQETVKRQLAQKQEQLSLHLEQARMLQTGLEKEKRAHREAERKRSALQKQLRAKKAELRDLQASTSWRVTAPMRRVMRILAKRRRK